MNKYFGQFFTPNDISELTSEILINKLPGKKKITIYDNSFGQGDLLFSAVKKVNQISREKITKVYGCEIDANVGIFAKRKCRNLNLETKNLKYSDTIEIDCFNNKKFDFSIINPPYGVTTINKHIRPDLLNMDNPPRDAQLLFIQDAIIHSGKHSRIAAIVNVAALIGGRFDSPSSRIRRNFLNNDILETIIKLPDLAFDKTPITTYIMVFDKSKPNDRKGKIQLIDASRCCEKIVSSSFKKKVINSECIEKIVSIYDQFENCNNKVIKSKIISNKDFITLQVPVVLGEKTKICKIPASVGVGTFLRTQVLKEFPNAKINSDDIIEGCSFDFDKTFEDNLKCFKKSLGEVADFIQGYHFKKESFSKENKFPVIKVSNIVENKIDYSTCDRVNLDNDVVKKYLIHKNDIIVALTGSNAGKMAFIDVEPNFPTYANQRVGIIRARDITPSDLYEILDRGLIDWIKINAKVSVLTNINSTSLLEFEV